MWFRVHTTLLNKAKVQSLAPAEFKALINLWCLAKDNDGTLPVVSEVAFALRMTDRETAKLLQSLEQKRFLDRDGETLKPHDWNEHQFYETVSMKRETVSLGVSTDRVKRFRERKRNGSETSSRADAPSDSALLSVSGSGEGSAEGRQIPAGLIGPVMPRSKAIQVRQPANDLTPDELQTAWDRHLKPKAGQPMNTVFAMVLDRADFDVGRFRRNHPSYCESATRDGWGYALSFWDWIEAGMLPGAPAKREAETKEQRAARWLDEIAAEDETADRSAA